jgi:hypothetical protein
VWDKLRRQVTVERQQLHRLLDGYRPLIERCAVNPPDDIELSALAAMLHSFYNGFENIFKRVGAELDGGLPNGEFWHRQLLDSMTAPGRARSAVISERLIERLDDYLEFRHFFRHAYIFNLNWDRMKTLVLGCEEMLELVEGELDQFLNASGGN